MIQFWFNFPTHNWFAFIELQNDKSLRYFLAFEFSTNIQHIHVAHPSATKGDCIRPCSLSNATYKAVYIRETVKGLSYRENIEIIDLIQPLYWNMLTCPWDNTAFVISILGHSWHRWVFPAQKPVLATSLVAPFSVWNSCWYWNWFHFHECIRTLPKTWSDERERVFWVAGGGRGSITILAGTVL